jgi:predicted alpha/beta hydrolase
MDSNATRAARIHIAAPVRRHAEVPLLLLTERQMTETSIDKVVIDTDDGFAIAGTLYGAANSGPVIQINSATAVPQSFYAKFAAHLATQGATVVTFDYRGIGESRRGPIRHHAGTMKQWAQNDAQAVRDWLVKTYPDRPLCGIGHSFGGQAFGLMRGNDRYRRLLLVGTQSGYWRLFPAARQLKLALMWYAVVPAATALFGYFPSPRFGLGENLPPGVMREWARWCRDPEYLMSEFEKGEINRFQELSCPILAADISDDPVAPPRTTAALRKYLPSGDLIHQLIDAGKILKGPIGHFGFFRDRFKQPLWDSASDFLLANHS